MIDSSKPFRTMIVMICVIALTAVATAEDPQEPELKVGIKGELVRVAHTNDGWVTLGYRTANNSVGQEWMLLEIGMTVMPGTAPQVIKRDAITLTTPNGVEIPLASQATFNKASLRALDARGDMVRDSINYFPLEAKNACRIGFFTDAGDPGRGLAFDEVELSFQRACLGRLYFQLPGDGIQYGQHFLNVRFANSVVNVPMKIMTKDELKQAKKEYKELEKEIKRQQRNMERDAKNAAKK
jgi:hypothetical protein